MRQLQQGGGQKAGFVHLFWGWHKLMSRGLDSLSLFFSSPKFELPWAQGGTAE